MADQPEPTPSARRALWIGAMKAAPTLADRRVALGMTQQQLGDRLGVSREYVRDMEAGRRPDGKPLRVRAMYELALCELERRAAEGRGD